MAHKLANGDYRHKDHLIRVTRLIPTSTSYMSSYRVVGMRKEFYTLREAVAFIEECIAKRLANED